MGDAVPRARLRNGKCVGVSEEIAASTELAPGRAAELIAAGAELIDVRRPYEFEGGHLRGARNIEMNELTAAADELGRERAVLFYCRSGNRSSMAVAAFSEAGFDAHNIAGGIQAWVAEDRPLEPSDGTIIDPLPPA